MPNVRDNRQENEPVWIKLENHVFDENNFYRVVNEKGYQDFLEHNALRSSPDGTESMIVDNIEVGHRPTSFPSFDKGAPDKSYFDPESASYIFESAVPMYRRGESNPATGAEIRGRHWAYRALDPQTGETLKEIPRDKIINIYKREKDETLYVLKSS